MLSSSTGLNFVTCGTTRMDNQSVPHTLHSLVAFLLEQFVTGVYGMNFADMSVRHSVMTMRFSGSLRLPVLPRCSYILLQTIDLSRSDSHVTIGVNECWLQKNATSFARSQAVSSSCKSSFFSRDSRNRDLKYQSTQTENIDATQAPYLKSAKSHWVQ